MSNVNAKPTWLTLGHLTIKRMNLHGWKRDDPGKMKLFLRFKHYGLHTEWINDSSDNIDEIEEHLEDLKENNML